MSEYPIVLCEAAGSDKTRWRFWCQHCNRYHTHSAEPGHRAAHCHTEQGKAAYPNGYVLKLDERG